MPRTHSLRDCRLSYLPRTTRRASVPGYAPPARARVPVSFPSFPTPLPPARARARAVSRLCARQNHNSRRELKPMTLAPTLRRRTTHNTCTRLLGSAEPLRRTETTWTCTCASLLPPCSPRLSRPKAKSRQVSRAGCSRCLRHAPAFLKRVRVCVQPLPSWPCHLRTAEAAGGAVAIPAVGAPRSSGVHPTPRHV